MRHSVVSSIPKSDAGPDLEPATTHCRKEGIIYTKWYIPNRKPFSISESLVYTRGGVG